VDTDIVLVIATDSSAGLEMLGAAAGTLGANGPKRGIR